MLVLARRRGESIHIGNQIVITIAKIRGNRVSVSVEAPKEILIKRDELVRTIQATRSTQLPIRGP